jgi:hypothetical protein
VGTAKPAPNQSPEQLLRYSFSIEMVVGIMFIMRWEPSHYPVVLAAVKQAGMRVASIKQRMTVQ